MRVHQLASLGWRWRVSLLWLSVGLCGLVFACVLHPMIGLFIAIFLIALLMNIVLFFGQDGRLSFKRVLLPLFLIAILFPYIRLPDGLPDVRPEFIIVLDAWGLLFLSHFSTGRPIRFRRCPTYWWFGLFGLSIIMSMVYAALVKDQPLIGRDFWELVKILQYFITFVLVSNLNITPGKMKRYYKIAIVILLFSALFGFLQYFNFAGINRTVLPYYARTQIEGLLVLGRIVGTTGNPNEFGALMVLAFSLALSGALFSQERGLKMLCWGAIPISSLALILTLSRSSLIGLFLAGATVLLLYLRQKNLKPRFRRVVALVLSGCIIGALILYILPEKALFRFSQLANFTEASSWQGRVINWKTHFAIWRESPWLGWGPGKADMETIVDNEWLLLLRRYGVVGLIVFFGLFGSLFSGLSRIRSINSEPAVVALSVALQGTLVGYALYMTVAAVYHALQLMSILLLFLGLAYSQWRPRRPIVQDVR